MQRKREVQRSNHKVGGGILTAFYVFVYFFVYYIIILYIITVSINY